MVGILINGSQSNANQFVARAYSHSRPGRSFQMSELANAINVQNWRTSKYQKYPSCRGRAKAAAKVTLSIPRLFTYLSVRDTQPHTRNLLLASGGVFLHRSSHPSTPSQHPKIIFMADAVDHDELTAHFTAIAGASPQQVRKLSP